MHDPFRRFAFTNSDLIECDNVIEKLMSQSGNPNSGCPLSKGEFTEAVRLLNLCGLILNRVFQYADDREEKLAEFVFNDDEEYVLKQMTTGNKHFEELSRAADALLDEDFSKTQAIIALAKERVERGIQWLDARDDLGTWEACFYPQTLKMSDPCNCIGGSIFGEDGDTRSGMNGYKRLCEHLKDDGLSPIDLGFHVDDNVTFDILQKEWLRRREEMVGKDDAD